MIGATLKKLLEEQGLNVNELSRRSGVPAQTLYSMIRRDSMKIDLDALLSICRALEVPMEVFCEGSGPQAPTAEEWTLLRRWRGLDVHGRQVVRLLMDAELAHLEKPAEPGEEREKVIPLYLTPAAAGYASPVPGEDFEDYRVPAASRADFAVRITGDSMEPYIRNGAIALARRGEIIRDGDVGLFFADGGMVCKQYCQDYPGNVYLFSLNRARKDADLVFPASSNLSLCCFGKILLEKPVPLPGR